MSVTTAAGTAPAQTTFLTASRTNFLDGTATGYRYLRIDNATNYGDWIELQFIKTNGTQVTVSVTNTTYGANYSSFVQSLVDEINTTAALLSADGVLASDFDASSKNPITEFYLYARTAGWPAARLQVAASASAGVLVEPFRHQLPREQPGRTARAEQPLRQRRRQPSAADSDSGYDSARRWFP